MNWYLIFSCIFLLGVFGSLAVLSFRQAEREREQAARPKIEVASVYRVRER